MSKGTRISNAFILEDISSVINMPAGKAAWLKETCIWCMDYCGHPISSEIKVLHEKRSSSHAILWSPENDINTIREAINFDDAIEFGAEAIAFFVSTSETEFNYIQRSSTTTGIDYWLGNKPIGQSLPFQKVGRLEVSGIMEEKGTNTLERRINAKLKQSKQSESTSLPVYVIVVVFSQLIAKMVIKNANS